MSLTQFNNSNDDYDDDDDDDNNNTIKYSIKAYAKLLTVFRCWKFSVL